MNSLFKALNEHKPWSLVVAFLPPVYICVLLWLLFNTTKAFKYHPDVLVALPLFILSPAWPVLYWKNILGVES